MFNPQNLYTCTSLKWPETFYPNTSFGILRLNTWLYNLKLTLNFAFDQGARY